MPTPPNEGWREHTAERWLERDHESYAECVAAIRRGETNKSHLATRFGKSRQSITALMMREFSVEQLRDIIGKRSMIVAAEAMEKQDELIADAKVKDLGAVSMAGKAAFDIGQLANGAPTEIVEKRSLTMSVDGFKAWLAGQGGQTAPGTGFGAGKVLALGAVGPGLDLGLAEGGEKAVAVPVGDRQPLKQRTEVVDCE